MYAPELSRRDPKAPPTGLVLMLHGGTQHSVEPVGERSASWRRAAWMRDQIAGRLHRAGLAVWLLRYAQRGWNAQGPAGPAPVSDARWALEQARRELGPLPVVLLGHSMGARTAVAVADAPHVTGVVALAPWLPADEPYRALAGRHLAAAHGRRDKITSARQTEEFVRRAGSVAASAEFHDIGPVGHYMFRRISAWNEFAASRSIAFVGSEVGPVR
jgi:predicted esterase